MPLVNVSLTFQTFISNVRQYFLLKKCEKLLQCKSFFNKTIGVFSNKVETFNELVKLMRI